MIFFPALCLFLYSRALGFIHALLEPNFRHQWSIPIYKYSSYNISKGGEPIVSENYGQLTDQLGSILRLLREEKGLTREWVAEHSSTGLRHLAAIELGEKNPSVDTLARIIRCLGTSADRVFYPELFHHDTDMEEISRLVAICNPKQRHLIRAFIKMLLEQSDLEI